MSRDETGDREGSRTIDVLHLARLCLLDLDAEELEAVRVELRGIIEHVQALLSVDTEGAEPSFGTSDGAGLRLREDVVSRSVSAESIMTGVPCQEHGFVKVPRVATGEKGPVRE